MSLRLVDNPVYCRNFQVATIYLLAYQPILTNNTKTPQQGAAGDNVD